MSHHHHQQVNTTAHGGAWSRSTTQFQLAQSPIPLHSQAYFDFNSNLTYPQQNYEYIFEYMTFRYGTGYYESSSFSGYGFHYEYPYWDPSANPGTRGFYELHQNFRQNHQEDQTMRLNGFYQDTMILDEVYQEDETMIFDGYEYEDQTMVFEGFNHEDQTMLPDAFIEENESWIFSGIGPDSENWIVFTPEESSERGSGLSEEVIAKYLKIRNCNGLISKKTNEDELHKMCVVCQDDLCQENQTIGILECGHEFHTSCIKKWLLKKNICPLCRTAGLPSR